MKSKRRKILIIHKGGRVLSWCARAYEVAVSGGLGTYPLTPDLARSFIAGREILAYRDLDDLAQMTCELFHQPESAGRARVVAEHTYAHRASRFVSDWLPGS